MNRQTLTAAVKEAERFIVSARKSLAASVEYSNPKENGAVKRASMDLTRALAEMRKPG